MRMKRFMWAAAILFLPLLVQAQEKKDSVLRFSLKQAQEYAITAAYNVKSAEIDLNIAKKKIFETTAIGLPQVSATAQYQNQFKVAEFPSTQLSLNDQPLNPYGEAVILHEGDRLGYSFGQPMALGVKENVSIDLTVSQLIFSGEYIVGLQASKVFKQYSEQALSKSKTDVAESVSKTYCLALVTAENYKILQQSYDVVIKLNNEVVQMNKQGFIEETDVAQIEITKANIENMLSSVKNQNRIAQNLLKFQMGVDIGQTVELTDSMSVVVDSGNDSYLKSSSFNIDNNIDYKIMLTQENLSQLSFRREKTKFLPTLSAFYRHQELVKKPDINFNPPDILGLSLNIPIFSSGMRIAQVKQAKLSYQKTQIARKMVEQSLLMDYDITKNSYETAFNNYLNQKKNLELSQKIYNQTIKKYKEGVSSSYELNLIQSQFLTTQGNYYVAVMDLFNAKAKLEKLLTPAQ
jgi:outer membrane protein